MMNVLKMTTRGQYQYTKHTLGKLTLAVSFLILSSVSAHGRDPSETTLETLTVTANKQEENSQEIPMGISVFDEVALDDKNVSSVVELADFVPNLMLFGNGVPGMNSPTMRGVSGDVASFSSSAGMFIDGIPILAPQQGFDDALLDIERVEVLRGPQGTLYGKNTETGAINIITRRVDNTFRGKISVDGGEDYKKDIAFRLEGPVVRDRLFFGVTGQYYDKEGFIDNGATGEPANDKQHWYGKGQLRWTPTGALDIQLIADFRKRDDGGNNMGLGKNGAAAYGLTASGDRRVYSGFTGTNESETRSKALKVAYDYNELVTLTSVTTHRLYKDITTQDFDYNPEKFMHVDNDGEYEKISQELRLAAAGDRMTCVAGLYYDKDDNDFLSDVFSDIPMMNVKTDRNITSETYAVFGQIRYALTSGLGVTGGLRYEEQESDFFDHQTNARHDASWDDVSPKLSVDFAVTPQIMAYATVAKGFRSGGFNIYAADPRHTTYDAETLWSYEIGVKTQFLDNRVIVNGALFYMDIDDMQVSEAITPAFSVMTNSAKASAHGAEIEARARLTRQITLTGNFGYTRIEFDEFQDALGNYEGNENPYAPAYTFSVGGFYRGDNGFYAGADLVGCGKMYFDKANQFARDAYRLVNAKTGYEAKSWDIYLYGKNLFDKEYDANGYYDGFYTIYSEPREIGIKMAYRF